MSERLRRSKDMYAGDEHGHPSGPDLAGPSILAYTPDGLGLGHLRRNTNIALRFAREIPQANAIVIGAWPSVVPTECAPGVDFIKLPSLHKTSSHRWRSRSLRVGLQSLIDSRSSMIVAAIEAFNPDLFLVDYTPAGRCEELLPVLDFLKGRRKKTKTVLGLRDILDTPDVIRRTWERDGVYGLIERYYDLVLIYGERNLFDAAEQYGLNLLKRPAVKYCGYVGPDLIEDRHAVAVNEQRSEREKRIVTVGGAGSVAFETMKQCTEAVALLWSDYDLKCTLITGPMMDCHERRMLEQRAATLPATVIPYVDNPLEYIRSADLVIGMAGYNTIVEAVALGKRMLAIPWSSPRAEQSLRASIFAARGYVTTRQLEGASPEALAETIRDCLEAPIATKPQLDLNGLTMVVAELRELAQ